MLKRILIFFVIFIVVLLAVFIVLSMNSVKILQAKIQEKLGPGVF